MAYLDNPKVTEQFDKDNMLRHIQDFPAQIEDAWNQVKHFAIPTYYINVKNVVVTGVGGSAIGGDIAKGLAQPRSQVPITIWRDYNVPPFINRDTLVIASSYSGDTEETISAFEQAASKGAKLISISSGGKIASLSRKYRNPHFTINYGSPPRAALGYSLMCFLGIFNKIDLMEIPDTQIKETVDQLKAQEKKIGVESPTAHNQAKQVAEKIHKRIPLIIGSGTTQAVALRFYTQISENAKAYSSVAVLPELNHNLINGFDFPTNLRENLYVVMLQSKYDHSRTKLRQKITLQILQKKRIDYETIVLRSANSPLCEVMLMIQLVDYSSYYLSLLNKVDPSAIPQVDYLKDKLAEVPFKEE